MCQSEKGDSKVFKEFYMHKMFLLYFGVVDLQKYRLCDEVETVWEFTYLGDRVSAGGGCEAAVTARTRCGCAKFRESGELLQCRRFYLKLKRTAYRSDVRPAILHESEVWCLKRSEIRIL